MTARVLLVDDDPRIADTAGDIIESLDLQMDHARTLKEAKDFVARTRYDCVLLDREIPVRANRLAQVQHGDVLFDSLVADPTLGDVPIVIITAHDVDGPDRAVDMVKAGAFDYVTKPFKTTGKTLASVVKKALESRGVQHSAAPIAKCPLTVSGLAAFIEKSETTIRNAYQAAGVPGPKPGEHSRRFPPADILLIARKRAESKRFSENERAKWNDLLTQLGQPTL